jgi:hypothetical protein
MKQVANPPGVVTPGADLDALLGHGNRRQIEISPSTSLNEMPCQIAHMKPQPLAGRIRICGFDRVVNDDEIAAASRQRPSDRGSVSVFLAESILLGRAWCLLWWADE